MGNDASAAVVQAREDVERIAHALYYADRETCSATYLPLEVIYTPWDLLPEAYRARLRTIVEAMLHAGVIYVGRRPERGPEPMRGQTCLPTT